MNYFSKIVIIRYACGHKKQGIDTYQAFVTKNEVKCPKCTDDGGRLSPLCDMRCNCEECGDREACDIYYAEKGFQLLEARFEEDWKEREFAKREAQ